MKPYIWAILTALTWGCVPIIEKIGLTKVTPFVGLFYRCVGVIIGIIILMFFKWQAISASFKEVPQGIFYLILGGFLASVVAQAFFYNALKTGAASKVVPISATYPLIAFVLGLIFLGEKLTMAKAGGMFFVLLGIMLLK